MSKKNRKFTMGGKVYSSMMDIARELGVSRIYTRNFEKYGIEEIDATNDVISDHSDNTEESAKEQVVEDKVKDPVKEEDEPEGNETASKKDGRFTRKLGTPEEISEAQKIGEEGTIQEFANYVKHFSVNALEVMANKINVNNWSSVDNVPIRKMHLLMELKEFYFPGEKTPVKTVSSWRKINLEKLTQIAKDNNLDYKLSDNEKIQRMHITSTLKNAGLNPADYVSIF